MNTIKYFEPEADPPPLPDNHNAPVVDGSCDGNPTNEELPKALIYPLALILPDAVILPSIYKAPKSLLDSETCKVACGLSNPIPTCPEPDN